MIAFNEVAGKENESLTAEKLQDMTGLTPQELNLQLLSLSLRDSQVLVREGQGSEALKMQEGTKSKDVTLMMSKKKSLTAAVKKTDIFKINRGFKSKFKRVQINTLQKKETRKESDAIHEKVFQDRKYCLDAAIVRTMKARNKVTHNELIDEVIRLSRFPCEIEIIVARIRHLIEMEYMRPDDKDPKIYYYIA